MPHLASKNAEPLHITQCNGQVEWFHQTLFRMIGKLTEDKKAQREQPLPELLQVYNSARSAVTGYSLHFFVWEMATSLS